MFKKLGFAVFMLIITVSSFVFAGGGGKGDEKVSERIVPCAERTAKKECGAGRGGCVWNSTRNSCMKSDCIFRSSREECSIAVGEICNWDEGIRGCQKKPCSDRTRSECSIGTCELSEEGVCKNKRMGK